MIAHSQRRLRLNGSIMVVQPVVEADMIHFYRIIYIHSMYIEGSTRLVLIQLIIAPV